jgi:hypothetical protein
MDPNKTLRHQILGRPKNAPLLPAPIPRNPDPPDTNRTPSTNFLYKKPLARSTNGAPTINEDGTAEDPQPKLHQTGYPGEDPPGALPSASQESRPGGGGLISQRARDMLLASAATTASLWIFGIMVATCYAVMK